LITAPNHQWSEAGAWQESVPSPHHLTAATMSVNRITLFKMNKEEDRAKLLDMYRGMQQKAVKVRRLLAATSPEAHS
jgi:hypothetical protein